jgi:hypothetical protein
MGAVAAATLLWWAPAMAGNTVVPVRAAVCAPPLMGANVTYYAVDASAADVPCTREERAQAHSKPILTQYHLPGVREKVREQLASMRASDSSVVRTLVWFSTPRSEGAAERRPPENFVAPLNPQALDNIRNFAADVAAAGFQRLLIAFAPQGRNSVSCRRETFGDCYDPSMIDVNWQVIRDVRTDIKSVNLGGLDVQFDLYNEGCPQDHSPQQAFQNRVGYMGEIARRYKQAYGESDMRISCAENTGNKLANLIRILDSTDVHPRHFEIHIYQTESDKIHQQIEAARQVLAGRNATLTVGEMYYDNITEARGIAEAVNQTGQCLAAAIQWPQVASATSKSCGVNVGPPYSSKVLGEAFR